MTDLYRKVKCPDCCWWKFKDGEVVGMTPCLRCNSTGHTYEPVDPHEVCREELRQVVTQVRKQCQERVERIFRDIDRSFSATNYHSPEAGKDLVNSIDINDWQALKKQEGVE